MAKWLKQRFCRHEFQLSQLERIAEDGPARVQWPCRKCGKLFKAHYGLDITSEHGWLVPNPQQGQPHE